MVDTPKNLTELLVDAADGQSPKSYTLPKYRSALVSIVQQGTILTSGSSYTMTAIDNVLIVNKTTGSATAITLPTTPIKWQDYQVKDGKGDAGTNPITIAAPGGALIDGAASYVIQGTKQAVTLKPDGTNWWIV